MKKLLFLVPVILLVAAACNNKATPPQTNQQTNNQQQTQPSPANQQGAADQTISWKIYSNNRVGYQFEYPASGLTLNLDETIKYPNANSPSKDLVQFATSKNTYSIETIVKPQFKTVEELLQAMKSDGDTTIWKKFTMDGQTAYSATDKFVTYVMANQNQYSIIKYEGNAPADYKGDDQIYSHILSTLKFTNTVALDNYLVINAWGVKFEKPQGMNDLLYVTKPFSYSTGDNTVALITQRLVDLNKSIGGKCNEYYLGLLGRLTEKGLQDAQKNGPGISDYVKIGNYYYYFTLPQEACFYNNSYDNEYAKLSGSQSSSLQATILKTLKVAP